MTVSAAICCMIQSHSDMTYMRDERSQDRSGLPRRRLLGAVAGAASLLAGCGGSGTEDPTTEEPTESGPTSTTTRTPSTTEPPTVGDVGRTFLKRFTVREYAGATSLLSDAGRQAIREAVPRLTTGTFETAEPAVERAWLGLTAQHGPFEELASVSVDEAAGEVTGTLRHAQADQRVRLEVGPDGITAVGFPAEYTPPSYASPDAYREQSLSFSSQGDSLEGTLTTPTAGDGPFPCVVLLQGSGIFDRDATAGPNQIFRDLAHGLAARGVASYRFDRRRPAEVDPPVTPAKLYVPDGVNAARAVAETDPVRSDAVVVAGHSAGGRQTPAVAAEHGGLAGMAVLDTRSLPLARQLVQLAEAALDLEFLTDAETERLERLRDVGRSLMEDGLEGYDGGLGPRAVVSARLEYDQVATADRTDVPTFWSTRVVVHLPSPSNARVSRAGGPASRPRGHGSRCTRT